MKQNLFNSIEVTRPPSNTFDLTHDVKMTGSMGTLMPCCIAECLPGDRWNISGDVFMRFAPIVAPIMHKVDLSIHYFFVPNRLTWENWETYITNGVTGGIPQFMWDDSMTPSQQRLGDYLSIPPCNAPLMSATINALPFAAYQAIYNEYYRDENLVTAVNYQLIDGIQLVQNFADIHNRAYEHDYFTACLPFAQKGDAVDIPMGIIELKTGWAGTSDEPLWVDSLNNPAIRNQVITNDAVTTAIQGASINVDQSPLAYDPHGSLEVLPTTINELRRAMRLQEWLEKNARGGTRYIENIKMHFGIMSSDARLQRPEYITGTKANVIISEVLNQTGANTPGNPAGKAVALESGYSSHYNCEEHGYIIGIMSIMPKAAYQQGIPRSFLKTDSTDFYWPSFANIGEQEVTVEEIFAYDNSSPDIFGYIPRYSEYRYLQNRVTGLFRTTLDFWHLGRIFANAPTLSQQFIECDKAENTRIFADTTDEDNLYIHVLNKMIAQRLMPVYGTPLL